MAGAMKPEFRRDGDEVIILNRTRATATLVGSVIFVVVFTVTGISYELRGLPALDAYIVGPLTAVVFYIGWLVARRTSIRLRTDGFVIENAIIKYVVPWRQGRQFYLENGIKVRLLDGRTYATWVFQGSLASRLDGYSAFYPILDQITAECDRIIAEHLPEFPPPPTRWRLQLPDLWVFLAVAGGVDGLIGLVALTR